MEHKDTLVALRSADCTKGLCDQIHNPSVLASFWADWPEYSGEIDAPIVYIEALGWDEYCQARVRLRDWLLTKIDKASIAIAA